MAKDYLMMVELKSHLYSFIFITIKLLKTYIHRFFYNMVKYTCTGRNLYNHCKQIGKPENLTFVVVEYKKYEGKSNDVNNYDNIRDPNTSYICTMSCEGRTYTSTGSSQIKAIDNAFYLGDSYIRSFL